MRNKLEDKVWDMASIIIITVITLLMTFAGILCSIIIIGVIEILFGVHNALTAHMMNYLWR